MTLTERMARIEWLQLRSSQLTLEARTCREPDRVAAINQEMKLIYDGLVAIREEQLLEQMERHRPAPRRWWQFRRRTA